MPLVGTLAGKFVMSGMDDPLELPPPLLRYGRWRRPGGRDNRAGSNRTVHRQRCYCCASVLAAPAERQLDADFAREGAVGGHDARFDFHLLRFAVELPDQIIHDRKRARNVANDQRIGAVVRDNVARETRGIS